MSGPTKLFVRALDGGGSPSIECTCGKVHMCPDADQEDRGNTTWKDYCEQLHADSPDTIRLHWGYDGVDFKELDGKIFVYDCECWVQLERYENWIWHNRSTISMYVNSRIDQMIKEAEHEKLMNTLKNDFGY